MWCMGVDGWSGEWMGLGAGCDSGLWVCAWAGESLGPPCPPLFDQSTFVVRRRQFFFSVAHGGERPRPPVHELSVASLSAAPVGERPLASRLLSALNPQRD